MAKKEFSKFFVASLKRTAMNVAPIIRRKQKLQGDLEKINEELESLESQLEMYDVTIKKVTGGYGVEELVERQVEVTDKVDKNGKPIKITKWNLKYPETIIPPTEEETNANVGADFDIDTMHVAQKDALVSREEQEENYGEFEDVVKQENEVYNY